MDELYIFLIQLYFYKIKKLLFYEQDRHKSQLKV